MNERDHEPEFLSEAVEFKVIFKFPKYRSRNIFLSNHAIKLNKRQKKIINIIAR